MNKEAWPSDVWPSIAKSDPPPPYAQVTVTSEPAIDALGRAIRDAFQDAMAMRGRLRDKVFQVHGFSGKKFRTLMNNLMSEVPDPRYLEIGLFHGASFCSALFRNKMHAVGIDNWSEYGGKREVFDDNLRKCAPPEAVIDIIETDFRQVDYRSIGKFNVLFYDGSHAEKDQYDGVFLPQPAMDDSYILIVDDWNWPWVRQGTFDALRDAKARVSYSVEVRTSFNGELPVVHGAQSEWHNGTILAVVSKPPQT
jgi:hypothetical protein